MIEVSHLSKDFNGIVAVDDLTFTVNPGDIVGFLGPNGAGKSTTMKMLTGFLPPTQGSITINGVAVADGSKALRQHIGYLPEGAPVYGDMTVFQFLHFVAGIRGLKGKQRKARLQDVIKTVDLGTVLNQPVEHLSKGFRRRVGLAQAIIHDPQILILDEPTDGLDPNQKHQVRSLIQALSKDKIVIISTHILEEVTAVCNRVMIIANGALRFDDTPSALAQRSRYYHAVSFKLSYAADISGLAELNGVSDMEIDRKSGLVTLLAEKDALILGPVTDHIQHNRLPIDTLYLEQGRLDDVFREITGEESAQ